MSSATPKAAEAEGEGDSYTSIIAYQKIRRQRER